MKSYRTRAGQLSAATLKALNWYSIKHGYRLTASSAFPAVTFIDESGIEHKVDILDVIEAYDQFKQRTHGRKAGA